METKKDLLQYGGDVATMRCHLSLINPDVPEQIRNRIEWLRESLEYENQNQKRVTVIKMIETKIKRLEKLI